MPEAHTPSLIEPADPHRRWIRLLSIMNACQRVGLTPISVSSVHIIAYLTEVLAPVWNLDPLDGKVLKQSNAPYYPALQQDVDRLIGMSLLNVDELKIDKAKDGTPLLLPRISLNFERANPILNALRELPGEETTLDFLLEVTQAFSRLPDDTDTFSMNEDATYGSPAIDTGQVIDVGEWRDARETATSHAAGKIRGLAGSDTSAAEIIDMYVSHIAYRVSHERL